MSFSANKERPYSFIAIHMAAYDAVLSCHAWQKLPGGNVRSILTEEYGRFLFVKCQICQNEACCYYFEREDKMQRLLMIVA